MPKPRALPRQENEPSQAEKALERRAMSVLNKGARESTVVSGVGPARAMLDAAQRLYGLERDLKAVQNQFNALALGLKDKEGARQLVTSAKKILAMMDEIDKEFPGGDGLPSAREYMEKVFLPLTEKQLREEIAAELYKESSEPIPDELLDPDGILDATG